ncbi:MAG: HAMP domain-containing protein [Xanthomonadaceae bacterium]|nr:HAMP domain-containing protein [Xanthomonadaceae bacterium]
MKIRTRIALWITGAGLITSLFFSLVVFFEMVEQPLKILDSELKSVGKSVISLLEEKKIPITPKEMKQIPVFAERYWLKVYDEDNNTVYQSELARLIVLPLHNDEHRYTVQIHLPDKQLHLHQDSGGNVAFRVRILKLPANNQTFLVQIARPMERLDEEVVDLIIFLLLGLTASTILLLLLSYFIAGRILKPISAITNMAKDINEKTLDRRIPLGKSQDELHQLSSSLNQMFDRLQYSFTKQKQFLASASHELKTPITMLRLFMDEAVQNQDMDESFRLQMISQRSNLFRMDRLVKTLLDLSALELKEVIEKQDFNLTVLIESLLEDFSAVMSAADISLETKLQENLHLLGDQDKIRRLLINILDNAIKYNYEGGTIELQTSEDEKNVIISLRNTGPGIPETDLKKVFEQFYRVEKSRSLQYGGAGLGLAIVRQIVKLHDGHLSMESDGKSWACITIALPRN